MLLFSPARNRRGLLVVAGAGLASALLVGATPAAALAAPQADTSYSFVSAPGEYIGAGRSESYHAPAATIAANGTAQDVTVAVTAGDDFWSVEFAAPRGETLRPGSYADAERAAFRPGRSPGLDGHGDLRGRHPPS